MPTALFDLALEALQRHYGFSDLRDGQRRAIAGILEGRDSLVVLPTGGGKSLCYQLPALVLPGLTIVVSPLIALMNDQVQALRRRRIAAAALHSGLSPDEDRSAWRLIASGQLQLLYLSPERLLLDRTLARLSARPVAILAIDEAHCVCEWGHDFRPAYLRLAVARQRLKPGVTVALTATATPSTRGDIVRVLGLRRPQVVVSGFDRPNLRFEVERATQGRERLARINALVRAVAPSPAIVYAGTREGVESVARHLHRAGTDVGAYHAGRSTADRSTMQDRFLSGNLRVLVATNAFGMGVDKPDVRLVVHLAPPGTIEDYYQEAGRASRDGAPGRCVVLTSDDDRHLHERFLARAYPPARQVRDFWQRILGVAGPGRILTLHAPGAAAVGAPCLTTIDEPLLGVLVRHGVAATEQEAPGDWRVRPLLTPRAALGAAMAFSPDAQQLLRAITDGGRAPVKERFITVGNVGSTLDADQIRAAVAELVNRRALYLVPPSTHIRLLTSASDFEALPIDWPLRRTRCAIERSRLDAMCAYVNTRRCRRSYLLRYFGQHYTPSACGGCDNCTHAQSGSHGRFAVLLRTALRGTRHGARLRPG